MENEREIVESMAAAASLLGLRKWQVQEAKRAGCRAFKPGSRINLVELRKWFSEPQSSANEAILDPNDNLETALAVMAQWEGKGQIPVSLTSSLTLMAWAVIGAKSLGCHKHEVAVMAVKSFMRDVREGVGDVVVEAPAKKTS